jgi:hypothetical protein
MDPRGSERSGQSPISPMLILRVVWAGLLLGPVVFMAVVFFQSSQWEDDNVIPHRSLAIAHVLMFTMGIPIALMIRSAIFKRARKNGGLDIKSYTSGNILFWAVCEGIAFLGLLVALINHTFFPTLIPVALCLMMQMGSFPREM